MNFLPSFGAFLSEYTSFLS